MATDQEIRDAGILYMPKQKYLQNPYNLPIAPVPPPVSEGIVNTNAFNNSGGNDFNQSGNAFGYGSPVSEVNVRTFNPQSNDPTGKIANAQTMYNKAFQDINDPRPSAKGLNARTQTLTQTRPSQEVMDYYGEQIMNNKEQYGAQGQYNSPYEDTVDQSKYTKTIGSFPSRGFFNRMRNKGFNLAENLPYIGLPTKILKSILPKQEDRGPGGGTYGIGGLSDDKKAAYNALAKQGYLFDGQNGFKTLTGKNFQAKNYVPNQLEIYNQMTEQGYKLDEDGNVIDPKTNKVIGKNKNYTKKKFLEASTMYKTNKIQEDKTSERNAAEAAAAAAGGNRSAQARQKARDDNTVAQAYAGNDGYSDGSSGQQSDGSYNDPFDPGGGEKDGGFIDGSNRRPFNSGGRAGYFFGGRVNYKIGGRVGFKNGGLASIL